MPGASPQSFGRSATPAGTLLARALLLGGGVVLIGLAGKLLDHRLAAGGGAPWWLLLAFLPLFFRISQPALTALLGFAIWLGDRGRARPAGTQRCPAGARTAVLVPICNEAVDRVFANVAAMREDLDRRGVAESFDVFLLSDSSDPACWLAEAETWDRLASTPAAGRVFYRRRGHNRHRKSGNIADFCRRWGGDYDYLVILDADSLMSAATLQELVTRMQAEPSLALLQVPPLLIGRDSLFGRLQQFAAGLMLPLVGRGLALWQGDQGNYWGHNAIVRTAAFVQSCGLPELPGRAPFGGPILSHDFVEAALLVRAGWKVRMAADLGGSYEEPPPTLLDHAARDRRWCQGNLQHLRLLGVRGLHPISRLHLLGGAVSYLISPLWLLFLVAAAVQTTTTGPGVGPGVGPGIGAGAWVPLLLLTIALLWLPRLLGLAALLLDPPRRQAVGGAARAVVSTLLESLWAALHAPLTMLFHAQYIAVLLAGRDGGWGRQTRDEARPEPSLCLRRHAIHLLGGGACLALAAVEPTLRWWIGGLGLIWMLAPLASLLTADAGLGRRLRRIGLFLTVEERRPPDVLRRTQALRRAGPVATPEGPLHAVTGDPRLRALHCRLLPDDGDGGTRERALARARDWRPGEPLSAADERLLLSDREALDLLAARHSSVA